ncbi:mRNA-decapping enzyme 1A [Stomoxys calcitrans]|uniref:mRNA-decapping enzyme C-terminal domain-containing protein n=1 Tax=Stomoxys calcitrans TaxID=35570 RepID=A0A1I8PGD1_STOCA|nr:mRNA-decapping enzyme 1A [Stomoxys calcitrans]
MADKSKTRMNLAAIKKVDPYAKDIVDTSSHVAFYIFDSDQNEWEKTDVEGAFFIYSRNAQPFHSIFINNRLNTTSFVEPITTHLELQAQAPFLLYRNERSRIRGFWFYNSLECERISKLVNDLVLTAAGSGACDTASENGSHYNDVKQNNNVNIFKMLSNAQQEFNSSQNQKRQFATANNSQTPLKASGNVLKFFEAAEVAYTPRILPNTLSVEQLEKQQRDIQPSQQQTLCEDLNTQLYNKPSENNTKRLSCSLLENTPSTLINHPIPRPGSSTSAGENKSVLNRGPDFGFTQALTAATCSTGNLPGEQISLSKIFSNLNLQKSLSSQSTADIKPALMPPTMFDKPATGPLQNAPVQPILAHQEQKEPLNKFQFIQAFNYLIQNDDDFVEKLHEAYLTKFGTYQ